MSSAFKLKWKTDLDKQVIIQNFEKRGWVKCSGDGTPSSLIPDDWNIYWATVWTVRQIFNP